MKRLKLFGYSLVLSLLLSFTSIDAADTSTYKETYVVGSELDYPPYALTNKQGQADGFSVDLIKAVARVMQLSVTFRVGTWQEVKQALEHGEVDILPFVAYSKERDDVFDFTAPHTITYDTYFMRKGEIPLENEEKLRDKTIVVMRADSTHEYLKAHALTENLVLTETVPESLRLLAAGKYDYAFVPRLVGLLTIKTLHLNNLETTGPIVDTSYGRGYAFAVKEGDRQLWMTLNEGLSLIKATGEYNEIYQKWFAAVADQPMDFEKIYRYTLVSGIFLLLILIIVLLWLHLLKRQVTLRTTDLVAEIGERQRVEKALRDSEHRYRRLVEGMQRSIIYSHDINGFFTYVSPNVENLLGFSQREFRTHYTTFLTDNPDNIKVTTYTGAVSRGEQIPPYELEIWHKNGHKVYLEIIEHPVFDEQGHVIAVEGIANDVTERKRVEQALQESVTQLQAIFDNTAVGITLADEYGKFLKINTKWAEMTGYSIAELERLDIQDLLHPEDNKGFPIKQTPLPTGKLPHYQMEKRYIRKDQRIFWGSVSIAPLYHTNGTLRGIIKMVTDITERKEAELALQASEARFRALVDAIPYGVEEIDIEGRITFTNVARHRMLGYSDEEMAGKTIWDFMDDTVKREIQIRFNYLLKQQPKPTPEFVTNCTKTGQAIEVQVDWNYKRNNQGQITGFVAVLTDVTERQRAERALRESEEKYRILFQLFPVGISITDPTGQLVEVNQLSEKLLDVSIPLHLQSRYDDKSWHIIRPDGSILPPAEYASVRALKEQTTITSVEMGIVKYDGQVTWLSVSAAPIPLEQYGVAVVYIDITERKKVEAALQKSEARLAEAQQLARLGFWEWNLISGEELCSKELWEILGFSPEKNVFTHELFERAIHPADNEIVLDAFEQAITKNKHYDLVFRIIKPDNTIHYVHALGRLIRDAKGRIQRFIGTAQDITDRKLAEEKVRESQNRLAEAQRIAHVGNWIWDIRTNNIVWSDEVYRIFGAEPKNFETTYEHFLNHVHPNDRRLVQEAVNETLYEKKPYSIDHRIVLPDGSIHFVHEQAEIAFDERNEPVQMIGIIQDITERKHTEQMLQMIQYTIDNVADSIFWIDENGRFINCNETACKRLGYTCQELQTLFVSDVDPDFKHERWVTHWQEVQQHKVMHIESVHRTKIGDTFPVEITIHNMQFGDIRYICAWARDITERKRNEQALKESRDFINKINQATPNVIYVYDLLEQKNFYVNEQIKTFLGYSAKEIRNMCDGLWVALLHPEDLPIVEGNLLQFEQVQDGQVIESEYRVKHACGEWRWLWSREVVFSRTAQGHPSQILGIIQDITERKSAEEALRASEQYRRTLIEEALIGLVLIDKKGVFIEVNSTFAKMVGYAPEEIIGHLSCVNMTPAEYLEEDKRQIQLLKGSQRFGPYEKEYVHKNGQRIPVRVSGLLIEHKGQRFAWTNVENITVQKQTEDVLRNAKEVAESANHAKSTFLANMSHELRTPLNGILGYTQLFKLDKTLTPEQQEGIDIIHRSGEHLLNLINDILDLSKVEAGRIELQETDFNFKSFIDGIIYLFKMRAQQRDVIFNYEQLSHLPHTVHADETRLRQILVNLLGNAVKFARQKVALKVGQHLEKIRFQIEDDGTGIVDSDLEKIFLPFQQVGDKNYKIQGTGLGLSITKKLVTMMNGTIQVKSVPGRGSIFWVELELLEVSRLVKNEFTQKSQIVGFEEPPYKILVVDDIDENRSIILNYLRPLGFEVLEASNSLKGINMALTHQPSLILMDLIMPEMDGFEAIRQIREMPTLKNVIIIAVSASVFDFHQQKSVEAGCDDFIAKPLRYGELLEKLQQYLHLTWIYEVSTEEGNKENEVLLKFEGPSPEQANVLLDLAMQGDILGITSYMTELTKQDETLILFASEVCHLARNFKTAKISELARRYANPVK